MPNASEKKMMLSKNWPAIWPRPLRSHRSFDEQER